MLLMLLLLCDRLHGVHGVQLFRRGGVYVRWKQFLTDEGWSKPVLLVSEEQVGAIGMLRPDILPKRFKDAEQMLTWIDKFAEALPCPGQHAASLAWFRSVVRQQSGECSSGPDLDQIVADLRKLGRGETLFSVD